MLAMSSRIIDMRGMFLLVMYREDLFIFPPEPEV